MTPLAERGRLLFYGALVVAFIGLVLFAGGCGKSAKPGSRAKLRGDHLPTGIAGRPAPQFKLTDARRGRFGTADLAGRPYAITFIYTNCKDVCPLIGEELRQSLEQLGRQASKTAVIAVSVDPKGDTVASVRRWLRQHHEPPNFHYLIGSARELRPVWSAYFVAPQPSGKKESAHTANVWLIDSRGRWRTKYSAGFPFNTHNLAHDLGVLIAERSRL